MESGGSAKSGGSAELRRSAELCGSPETGGFVGSGGLVGFGEFVGPNLLCSLTLDHWFMAEVFPSLVVFTSFIFFWAESKHWGCKVVPLSEVLGSLSVNFLLSNLELYRVFKFSTGSSKGLVTHDDSKSSDSLSLLY